MTKILVVHSRKGGVGKTTIAYELAWLLGGVLVDLEWDEGSASRMWGYRHEDRLTSRLVDAFEQGKVPKPIHGHRKPDLVPGHPLLGSMQPTSDAVSDAISSWAESWPGEWVVVDTHPGSNPWSDGACACADIVLTPVPLRTKELEATAGMVEEMADFPLVLVPNMVPRVPDAAGVARLARIVEGRPVQIARPIPAATAIGYRRRRIAMTAEDTPAKAIAPVVERLNDLADFLRTYSA